MNSNEDTTFRILAQTPFDDLEELIALYCNRHCDLVSNLDDRWYSGIREILSQNSWTEEEYLKMNGIVSATRQYD